MVTATSALLELVSSGGEVKGVGLGLYISRRLVQAHGSELTVTSEPGKGSVFGFELPLENLGEGEGT